MESINTREIKFRAFVEIGNNSEIKAMIPDVVYTGHSLSCDTESFNEAIKSTGYQYDSGDCVFTGEGKEPIDADEFNFSDHEGDFVYFEGEVMQFSGLFDKNRKEIFEGDIVACLPAGITGAVRWSNELSLFELVGKLNGEECTATIYSHQENGLNTKREVIGNIYEHSHLLK